MNPTQRPRRNSFLVYGSPDIQQAEIDEVVHSMKSGWLGTGRKVKQFEEEFAEYRGARHVAAVNSCTAALHLSLLALEMEPGDEVITTPLTFCATINAIIHAGAVPVLADVDPETMNLNPQNVAALVNTRTKAILPVHFGGRSADMTAILKLAGQHNLKVVEDCAHAIETEFQGQPAGTIGDFGCFSFYPTKNMTTGEGGMIICRQEEDLDRIKRSALHGLSHDAWRRFLDKGHEHYYVTELGFKYNMTDIQAAIGIHQLRRIEHNSRRREQIWNHYQSELEGLPLELPSIGPANERHALHLFPILIDESNLQLSRDEFVAAMQKENIGTGIHYQSVAVHPYYKERFHWQPESWPIAHDIGSRTVSLPLSPSLTDDDVEDVIAAVHRIVS